MGNQVDVLAVIDAACCVLAIDKVADPQRQLEAARAAVAELIKAAKSAEQRLTYINTQSGKRIDADLVILLRAALARCGVVA